MCCHLSSYVNRQTAWCMLTSEEQFSCPVLSGSALPWPEELCSPPAFPPSLPPTAANLTSMLVPHSSRTKISHSLGPPPAPCPSSPFSFPHHIFPFLPTLTLPAGPSHFINAHGRVVLSLFPLKSNGRASSVGIFVKIWNDKSEVNPVPAPWCQKSKQQIIVKIMFRPEP